MINLKQLRNNPTIFKQILATRNFDEKIIDSILEKDQDRVIWIKRANDLREKKKIISKEINKIRNSL